MKKELNIIDIAKVFNMLECNYIHQYWSLEEKTELPLPLLRNIIYELKDW
jgi:hypothetical protein